MDDLSGVISEVIFNVALLAISAAGAFLVQWLRANISQKHLETGVAIARIAVEAVEQHGTMQGWESNTKLIEALALATNLGKKAGISLSDEQWSALLEQSVAELKMAEHELLLVNGSAQRKTSVLTPPETPGIALRNEG